MSKIRIISITFAILSSLPYQLQAEKLFLPPVTEDQREFADDSAEVNIQNLADGEPTPEELKDEKALQYIKDINLNIGREEQEAINLSWNLHSEYDLESGDFAMYNTGFSLRASLMDEVLLNVTTALDGKVDDFDSSDFELDSFMKQFKISYKLDTENSEVTYSVGKMITGAKTDQSTSTNVSGVMGYRLSVALKSSSGLQQWMSKLGLSISKIELTRYNYDSKYNFDFGDINKTDMTSVGIYINKGHKLHSFLIIKFPDSDNASPDTTTLGSVYMFDGQYSPALFGLVSKTESDHVDLTVYVLSLSARLKGDLKAVLTTSLVTEGLTNTESKYSSLTFTKNILITEHKKSSVGVKFEYDNSSEDDNRINFIYKYFVR